MSEGEPAVMQTCYPHGISRGEIIRPLFASRWEALRALLRSPTIYIVVEAGLDTFKLRSRRMTAREFAGELWRIAKGR